MFDIRWIRANPERFDDGLAARGLAPKSAGLVALDERRRAVIATLQDAQEKRNAASRRIGEAKRLKDEALARQLMAEVATVKETIARGEEEERAVEAQLREALSVLPNLPLDDVPMGEDETGNVEYFGRNGSPEVAAKTRPAKPALGFPPRQHFELEGVAPDMDFEVAAKLSGSRFVVLRSDIARLERALGQFMLNVHADEHGFVEVAPPLLVRDEALYGTGNLPKFGEDLFFVPHGEGRLALIPTAEVPLTNLVREQILAEGELPLRFTALTQCFRSEAGSAGRDTRGMLRQHQFQKVEMVSITAPDISVEEHERMLACAETVLSRLGLHYRVMTLCSGDMGFSARKTYDLEVWLPGQDTYREISSVSLCGDFQARRMDARYRDGEGRIHHVHTLNGSGTAVGRALIAVLENFQDADGSVAIPSVLVPLMGGRTRIGGRG